MGELGDGVLGREVVEHPGQQRREAVGRALRDRQLDVLALAAVALRRHDHAPGDHVGGGGAELAAHEVQAGVDAGGRAGAGDDVAVVDEQDVGVEQDRREAVEELLAVAPVRGAGPAVEQAGGAEDERATAHRQQRRAAVVGLAQRRRAPPAGTRPGWSPPGTATRSAPSTASSPCSGMSMAPTLVRSGSPGRSPQTRNSIGGTPSSVRSIPKTSQSTPNSNGATSSISTAATVLSMPREYLAGFCTHKVSSATVGSNQTSANLVPWNSSSSPSSSASSSTAWSATTPARPPPTPTWPAARTSRTATRNASHTELLARA